MAIEPNKHRTSLFHGKYSYHTHLPENSEGPNFPNVSVMFEYEIFVFSES